MDYQPIEVITFSGKRRQVEPVSFTWNDQTYVVEDIGRRWLDQQGEHILVLTYEKQTYELILDPGRTTWFLDIGKLPPMKV